MAHDASSQRCEVVPAFEDADDTPGAMLLRDGDESARDLVEPIVAQLDLRERVVLMRIKSGGEEQHLGPKLVELGHDALVDRAKVVVVIRPRIERKIHREPAAGADADLPRE